MPNNFLTLTELSNVLGRAPSSEPVAGGVWIDNGVVKLGPGIPPTIDTQPSSQSLEVGDTATLTVAATNATSYQWQLDSGSGFADISGATSTSYTTPVLALSDNGNDYRCVVTGLGGVTNTSTATLTVTEPSTSFDLFSHSGQSLSLGSVGGSATPAVISVDSFASSRMFSPGGTRPRIDDSRVTVDSESIFADRFASLTTLAESVSSNFGETYNMGIAAQNSTRDVLHGGTGRGAMTIDQLSLGSYFFADLMVLINRAKTRIEAAGGTFDWPLHWWAQGEADAVGGTSYATYRAALVQYFTDLKTYGNAQLDGSYSPKFFMYQPANPYVSSGVQNWGPADAILDAGVNETDMICVGSWYWLPYADTAHLTSLGYRYGGEQLGKVSKRTLAGEDWKPVYWTNASRSGTTITLTYHIPADGVGLVKDTSGTYVTDPGDAGFEYSGANITAVNVTDTDEIQITIDADAGGTLGYARQVTSNNIGPTQGARGIIRDQDPAVAAHDSHPLFNWACHQEEVLA